MWFDWYRSPGLWPFPYPDVAIVLGIAGLFAPLPVASIILDVRSRRRSQGFPVLPAHENTADEPVVQGTSASAKISNWDTTAARDA
jgi:hypothetical protein